MPLPLPTRRLLSLGASILASAAAPPAGRPAHAAARQPAPAEPIPDIAGEDPRGRPIRLTAAPGERVLVTLTDCESRVTLGTWRRALAAAVRDGRPRLVTVVALPRFVLGPFRGSIRSAFRADDSTAYVLDWGGAAVRRAARGRALPCVLVIGPEPQVTASACGPLDPASARALAAALAGPDAPRGAGRGPAEP